MSVRLALLGSNPAGVFHDEAEKGFSAKSLLEIGGIIDFTQPLTATSVTQGPSNAFAWKRMPLFVNVWGSYTSTLYQWAAVPFVALAGLNAWSVRLPAALAGSLNV